MSAIFLRFRKDSSKFQPRLEYQRLSVIYIITSKIVRGFGLILMNLADYPREKKICQEEKERIQTKGN